MNSPEQLLSITSASKILGYKNRRSAIRWCINNGVEIFSYHGSARKFVLKAQFEWVRYQKFFKRAVKKNPDLEK